MYNKMYTYFTNYIKDGDGFSSNGNAGTVVLAALGVLVLIIVQLFIVQFLWNTVLTRVVSVTRPLPSLLYTLGLLVLVAMVLPGAM